MDSRAIRSELSSLFLCKYQAINLPLAKHFR
ncbi:hypothetical protein FRAHR75_1800004 [Frankia sp. Hr75.2]|nr:hypothetical protein FRAHR75_1800004 [Frankia sp. Hr75.2]SQD99332.1 hypothetical protein FMEAI12_5220002 [Parafrankia sp. Ea1.12]